MFIETAIEKTSDAPEERNDRSRMCCSYGARGFVRGGCYKHLAALRPVWAPFRRMLGVIVFVVLFAIGAYAQPRVTIDHNTEKTANAEFKFSRVPAPARNDAASKGVFKIVDAEVDGNAADLAALNDGVLPDSEDQPRRNFFLNTGSGGGRLQLDLGAVTDIAQINSYSWHSTSRGPQVYRVWASDGSAPNFCAEPKGTVDPERCGWKSIAIVDTRTNEEDGGQYGVSVSDASGSLGRFRYFLFDMYPVEVSDGSGNTFYSEIDVVAKK